MNRRNFIKSSLRAGTGMVLSAGLLNKVWASPAFSNQWVKVNVPTYSIELFDNGVLTSEYRCRVGRPGLPTPIGRGKIVQKRDTVVFRYLSGPYEGDVIERSYLNPEGRYIQMPYDKMKGMDFTVNGRKDGPVFHSTTDYWTIGTPKSHGCIGLTIDEMLDFYSAVRHPLPELELTYETMFYDTRQKNITFWADIYNYGTNSVEKLFNLVGKPDSFLNMDLVRNNIEHINKELDAGVRHIQKLLLQGKDPKDQLHRLNISVNRDQLLWWKLT